MTRDVQLSVEREPRAEDERVVVDGLRAFNVAHVGEPREQRLTILARAPDSRIVGGLVGHTKWGWLYVAKLWLDDRHRGGGLGTRLMLRAEEEARARGCADAMLDTFEYQARPFYEKLGYEVFGVLEGFPPGHRQYYLRKSLGEVAARREA